MKKRKVLALLLAGAMSIGCLAGCGQNDSDDPAGNNTSVTPSITGEAGNGNVEEPSLFNADGSLPLVNEPVTLKVLTQDQPNYAYNETENALLWGWLEEKTGIHFEVESYPAEELAQKLPLIMATPEDHPDLFFGVNFTAADVLSYGTTGQLLMLDDLIEKYGANIQECLDTLDYAAGATYSADGHIYSLPSFNGALVGGTYGVAGKWLERVNMEMPTTIEELYEVFQAIQAHGDANGDGIQGNEYCWSGTMSSFRRSAQKIFGLNCYWPWKGCIFDAEDDVVYFAPTSEKYKYMLEWLNKMYEEGMIDPETFTQASAEYTAKRDGDLVFFKNAIDDPEKANYTGREGEFWAAPIGTAMNDPLVTLSAAYQTDIGAVSAHTEYPEVCVLLLDYLFTEEASKAAYWGQEGIDYKVVDEENFLVTYPDGHTKFPHITDALVSRWNRDEWVQPAATELERIQASYNDEYGVFAFQNYLKFTAEESETIAFIEADLGLFCDDYFTGFINGTYDIEKDWDKYVAECNSMKLDELIAVYQAAYNRYFGIE